MSEPATIVLTGPTASGKATTAFELALRVGGEIISMDSMKVYRELDIGTAKPPAERRARVPHHVVDLVAPDAHYSTGDWLRDMERARRAIEERGAVPIVSGGTPLYLKGLLDGFAPQPPAEWPVRERLREEARARGTEALHARLRDVDPVAAEKYLPGDLRRIVRALEVWELTGRRLSDGWSWDRPDSRRPLRLFGIGRQREDLYARADRRVLVMVERGLFEEAERLRARQPPAGRSALQCIGYKEVLEGWESGASRGAIVESIQRNTRRLVKRQIAWFRKLPIEWIPCSGEVELRDLAEEIVRRLRVGTEPPGASGGGEPG